MANAFSLQILTPERDFYEGRAYSVTVESIDGRRTVMAGHTPMVTALTAGNLEVVDESGTHVAFHSEGYMDVMLDGVFILCQACEWPQEIDERRAQEAERRALERIHQDTTGRSKVALLRALARLKAKKRTMEHD